MREFHAIVAGVGQLVRRVALPADIAQYVELRGAPVAVPHGIHHGEFIGGDASAVGRASTAYSVSKAMGFGEVDGGLDFVVAGAIGDGDAGDDGTTGGTGDQAAGARRRGAVGAP